MIGKAPRRDAARFFVGDRLGNRCYAMPNHKSPIADLRSPVPAYLPLPDAARKYHISEKVLTRLIQDGRIEAAKLPSEKATRLRSKTFLQVP